MELRFVVTPDLLHGEHLLAHQIPAPRIDTVVAHLLDEPARADAEQEAPLAEMVNGRHLLGEDDRARCVTMQTPVPSLTRDVTAAAAPSTVN
jgi:hypothetical protein